MRKLISCGFVFVLLLSSARAQDAKPDLDKVLRDWEKTMTGLSTFQCQVERKSRDRAFGVDEEFKGSAMFAKPAKNGAGNQALLRLEKKDNNKVFEQYIFTAGELYEFVPSAQVVRIHQLPKAGQMMLPQDNLVSFLFGIGAAQAKASYDMKLEEIPAEDAKHYYSIRIKPKNAQARGEFIDARLVLYRSNNMPAQIWYVQPNKNETTWNFTKVNINPPLAPNTFAPDMKGWQVQRVPLLPVK
jgi:TIGR03009 family protein